tara:strand:+ start:3261 stop:4406 length:1146 start_codon:yes stop_codon:yes gene_type:complete
MAKTRTHERQIKKPKTVEVPAIRPSRHKLPPQSWILSHNEVKSAMTYGAQDAFRYFTDEKSPAGVYVPFTKEEFSPEFFNGNVIIQATPHHSLSDTKYTLNVAIKPIFRISNPTELGDHLQENLGEKIVTSSNPHDRKYPNKVCSPVFTNTQSWRMVSFQDMEKLDIMKQVENYLLEQIEKINEAYAKALEKGDYEVSAAKGKNNQANLLKEYRGEHVRVNRFPTNESRIMKTMLQVGLRDAFKKLSASKGERFKFLPDGRKFVPRLDDGILKYNVSVGYDPSSKSYTLNIEMRPSEYTTNNIDLGLKMVNAIKGPPLTLGMSPEVTSSDTSSSSAGFSRQYHFRLAEFNNASHQDIGTKVKTAFLETKAVVSGVYRALSR